VVSICASIFPQRLFTSKALATKSASHSPGSSQISGYWTRLNPAWSRFLNCPHEMSREPTKLPISISGVGFKAKAEEAGYVPS